MVGWLLNVTWSHDMDIGKVLIGAGLVLVVVGAVVLLGERFGLRPGNLPLDFQFRRESMSFYFPLGTSILVSLVISLLFMLFNRIR
jgi:hypothetical protein